jgi:phosphonopyruvate decarboxylase
MIAPKELHELFQQQNLNFYAGVPDSLLKDFCAFITDNVQPNNNIITANEGNAIALAAGYHIATGETGVVYMQNSGLGNCVNPLTSLTDPHAYSIPMLLVIGWRGEPGKKDEPQHIKKGMVTLGLLNTLAIEYGILPNSIEEAKTLILKACDHMNKHNEPYAIVVRKGTFEPYNLQNRKETNYAFNREDAIKFIAPLLDDSDIVVSTTGKTSRELFEY